MKKILLFALTTFFVQSSFCQNLSDTVNVEYSKNSPRRFSLGISIPTGGALWTISPNLNNFLRGRGIPTQNFATVIPMGISYQQNRFKINLDAYYGLINYSNKSGVYATTLGASLGIISTEYAVFADRNNFLYLSLGLGQAIYTQTITIANYQPTTFTSAIQNGGSQSIILKNTTTFLDLGIEFLNRTKANSLGLSTKAGYRFGLENTPWKPQFANITDTPSDKIDSFYLQIYFNIPYRFTFKNSSKKIPNN